MVISGFSMGSARPGWKKTQVTVYHRENLLRGVGIVNSIGFNKPPFGRLFFIGRNYAGRTTFN